MKKIGKRFGSILLALCMIMSLLPMSALANEDDSTQGTTQDPALVSVAQIGETKHATLSEALNAVKDGETIQVLAPATVDMTETYAITGKTITLDLNGQTVTWKSSAKNMIEIGTDGGLTIQDTTNTGVLHFNGTGTTNYGSGITTSGNGSLSLTGGTVLYEHGKAGYGLNITGSSTFAMTGGTVKIAGAVNYAVRLASTSRCQLNGGKILFDETATASTLYGVYAVLFSTAGDAAGFSLGNLTVDGSMIPNTKTVHCVYGYNESTPVTVSGGTYTANGKSASYAVGAGSSNNTAISGGTFNGAVKAAIGKVTGGLFSVQPSAAYLPEGKIYEMQQDGYYHVVDGTYVARLGTVGYTSWEELFEDASTTTTASAVYILADVNEITVPAGKNVTLYNSGNCTIGKITNNGTCKIISYAMIGTEVVNNGSLNLGHEVKSIVNNQGATMVATSYDYAKVTDSITNSGTMTISKGTYPCTITNSGTITLTGGSFAQDVTDWCADDYTTQKSDGLWVVVKDGPHAAEIDGYWYTSLSAAISAAKDGDTVKLLMDTTLTPTTTGTGLKSAITISGTNKPNLTLDLNGKTISWDQSYASQTLNTTPVMFSIAGGANITITGNGTIDTELGSNASYGINMTTSTKNQLTIENGTFTGAPTAIQVEKGTLTILGGTFKLAKTVAQNKPEQAKYVVNAIDANWKDDTANISIQGGSFCFDPSDNPEGEGTTYLMNGYKPVQDTETGTWAILVKENMVAEILGKGAYETVSAAIEAAEAGDTVTLRSQYADAPITISKAIAVDLADTGTDSSKFVSGVGYQKTESGDCITFAVATYTVTFRTNGGSAVPAQTVTHNSTASKPGDPTRSGYTFAGWYSDEGLTTAYDFNAPVTQNLTLFAKWTYIPVSIPDDTPSTPTYSISLPGKVTGGEVSLQKRYAEKGETVTITVTPDDGYVLDELTVTDKDGDSVKLTWKDNKYTFTMPGSEVEITATFVKSTEEQGNPFTDVSTSDYYYDAVLWAVENGVTSGTSATTFGPNVTVSRAQMMTFLWRVHGSPKATGTNPFTDVSTSDYYYDAVLWAVANGVTSGTSATTFSPDMNVTRAQAVTFQWRAAGSPVVSGSSFSDVATDAYYVNAVSWAVANGITSGTGGNAFSPDAVVSRAQAVTFLYREQE